MSSPPATSGSLPDRAPSPAPERPLPSTHFYSIEYPGYVKPESVPRAIRHLGGQARVDDAFRRGALSKSGTVLELSFRPDNPFAHPVSGDLVGTNSIVLKVVKRRRRQPVAGGAAGTSHGSQTGGEYAVEAVGAVHKTVRFRSMVDFQYTPDMEDPMAQLRVAMGNMDVEAIKNFRFQPEKEDYLVPVDIPVTTSQMEVDVDLSLLSGPATGSQDQHKMKSNLRVFPPPLFSRQGISLNYNFKANSASVPITTVDEKTGEEKTRLINRMRWKGLSPVSISYHDEGVPDKPSPSVEEARKQVNPKLLERLQETFEERPVWTRTAIMNQFSPNEAREIQNSKALLPLTSYVFNDGPWRDTLVRFTYDPRTDIEGRFYQRLYFRNVNNPVLRPSVSSKRHERAAESSRTKVAEGGIVDRSRSHIFDGLAPLKETAAFQLCDITDPMLKGMIEDEDGLRDECSERDGWYTTDAFERIKTVLRHKFYSLQEGHIASDAECAALLLPLEGTSKPAIGMYDRKRAKHGKHNLAKGAMRPEDAAAERLRSQLRR